MNLRLLFFRLQQGISCRAFVCGLAVFFRSPTGILLTDRARFVIISTFRNSEKRIEHFRQPQCPENNIDLVAGEKVDVIQIISGIYPSNRAIEALGTCRQQIDLAKFLVKIGE